MQTKPDYLDRLLDCASEKAGSDYKLAQLLDVHRATVSQWRSGKKTCPAGDVALMAEIAGFQSEEWLARAVISQYEGTAKGDKLYRALRKSLVATGAVIASAGASALPIFSPSAWAFGPSEAMILLYTMYIMLSSVCIERLHNMN